MADKEEIKYCVCAMIDLIGFSSHLEMSAYDLRTNIGKQAVSRLDNLENVLHSLSSEREKRIDYYPSDFHVQRINDAVFFTMDLDDLLIPSIGRTNFQGLSSDASSKLFSEEQSETWEKYQAAYTDKVISLVEPLIKFVGLISRLHISLNKLEDQHYFPGAKTIISTGFRRPFLSSFKSGEDYFSANFALSNAYIAEKSLGGPNLYLDNGIIQMISFNKFAKHILRFAHFQFKQASFDCFDNHENLALPSPEAVIYSPIEIKLFRKDYQFANLNPSPLTHLQHVPVIMDYLTDRKTPDLTNIYYKHIYNAIKKGINRAKAKSDRPPQSFIFNGTNDLSSDIGILYEFLSAGKSKTRETIKEQKFNEEYANLTEEGKNKIRELMNHEVKLEVEKIKIEEAKNDLFKMNEETLMALSLVLEGDLDLLDFSEDDAEIRNFERQ